MGFLKTSSIISSLVLILFISCFTVGNASCCGGFNCASDCACSCTRDDRTTIISMDPLSPVRTMPQMLDKMVRLLEEAMKFAGSRDRPVGEVRALPKITEEENNIIWSFQVPQDQQQHVEVSLEGDMLVIEKKSENAVSGFGKYETRYKLPDNCDKGNISVETKDDNLRIEIPKTKRKIFPVPKTKINSS